MAKQLVNPVRVRRHDDPMDLVQLAHSVATADQFVLATTGGKLMVVVDQIRALQEKVQSYSSDFACTLFYVHRTHDHIGEGDPCDCKA